MEDATLTLLHNAYKHLDKKNSYLRLLFVDFSSAFNTIQPYVLIDKLNSMGVHASIIKWIDSFMFNRTQYVTVNEVVSSIMHISTGAPQGCVISPILFILYTNDCVCYQNDCLMLKFADDTILAGLISNSETNYRNAIVHLAEWCSKNFLHLNATKTKEIVIDYRTKANTIHPVHVDTTEIEQVTSYKYLGTHFDSKLSWKANTDAVYKKGQQRLHFLRRLRFFNVNRKIMLLFYTTFIQSVLTSNFLIWYGSLTVQGKNKLNKIVKTASKVCGANLDNLDKLYKKQALRKVNKIIKDASHNLHNEYSFLPSGRRIRSLACKTTRSCRSFVPNSIRLFNDNK